MGKPVKEMSNAELGEAIVMFLLKKGVSRVNLIRILNDEFFTWQVVKCLNSPTNLDSKGIE